MPEEKNKLFGEELTSLLEEIQSKRLGPVDEIDLSLIRSNPYSSRTMYMEEVILPMADDIKKNGQKTPIILRRSGKFFEIVDGEKRFRGAKVAHRLTILSIVGEYTDEQLLSVSLQKITTKETLSAIEEGMIYRNLIKDTDVTTAQLAERLGKKPSYITRATKLLLWSNNSQEKVIKHNLRMGHVENLIGLTDQQIQLCLDLIIEHMLNEKEAAELAKEVKDGRPLSLIPTALIQELNASFGCVTTIRGIELKMIFDTPEDLWKAAYKMLGKTPKHG